MLGISWKDGLPLGRGEGTRGRRGAETPHSDREQEVPMQEVLCHQGGDRQRSCWLATDGWWAPGDPLPGSRVHGMCCGHFQPTP